MFVVSIFAGVVGVSVDEVNKDTRLSNAASRALADIRYAHELAMAHRREVDIYVDTSLDNYVLKWHDTGAYVTSPVTGDDLVVTFNRGEYADVDITSSGLGGRLSFTALGAPLIGGSTFSSETTVMYLNSKLYLVIYPSGYAALHQIVSGGSVCS